MRSLGIIALGAIILVPSIATADADRCASAYEATQRLRRAGKLGEAEIESTACAAESCAPWVRKECAAWLDEIRAARPSITITVTGRDGCDVSTARVLIDGRPAEDAQVGRALPLDPGTHVVRVEIPNAPPDEHEVVVAEGQKARPHPVTFAPAGTACGAPKAARMTPVQSERKMPTLGWVVGGIGAASLAVGGGFEIAGLVQQGDLDSCRPRCATDDVDAMRRKFLIGDVLVGAGVVALGAALVLWLTNSETPRPVRVDWDLVRVSQEVSQRLRR